MQRLRRTEAKKKVELRSIGNIYWCEKWQLNTSWIDKWFEMMRKKAKGKWIETRQSHWDKWWPIDIMGFASLLCKRPQTTFKNTKTDSRHYYFHANWPKHIHIQTHKLFIEWISSWLDKKKLNLHKENNLFDSSITKQKWNWSRVSQLAIRIGCVHFSCKIRESIY